MGAPKSNYGRTCLQKVLSLLKNLILLFPFFMLDKGLTKLFESITGRLPALHPWFWRCKVIRKSSDNQVFFMKFFLQPFPQPFPFSATVPILTSWPYPLMGTKPWHCLIADAISQDEKFSWRGTYSIALILYIILLHAVFYWISAAKIYHNHSPVQKTNLSTLIGLSAPW